MRTTMPRHMMRNADMSSSMFEKASSPTARAWPVCRLMTTNCLPNVDVGRSFGGCPASAMLPAHTHASDSVEGSVGKVGRKRTREIVEEKKKLFHADRNYHRQLQLAHAMHSCLQLGFTFGCTRPIPPCHVS